MREKQSGKCWRLPLVKSSHSTIVLQQVAVLAPSKLRPLWTAAFSLSFLLFFSLPPTDWLTDTCKPLLARGTARNCRPPFTHYYCSLGSPEHRSNSSSNGPVLSLRLLFVGHLQLDQRADWLKTDARAARRLPSCAPSSRCLPFTDCSTTTIITTLFIHWKGFRQRRTTPVCSWLPSFCLFFSSPTSTRCVGFFISLWNHLQHRRQPSTESAKCQVVMRLECDWWLVSKMMVIILRWRCLCLCLFVCQPTHYHHYCSDLL